MSKSGRGYGKSLKGVVSVGSQGFNSVNANNIVATSVKTENFEVTGFLSNGIFSEIQIQSGVINNTVIGAGGAATAYFRDVYVGKADPAQGYPVYFYANTPDNYFAWDPELSQLRIEGNQYIRDQLRVANLEITGNVLQSYRNIENPFQTLDPTGFDIILDPTGAGIVQIRGPLVQTGGGLRLVSNTAGLLQTRLNAQLITQNGDIELRTGVAPDILNIVSIATGTNSLISFANVHSLNVGDYIEIQGTNTAPHFNGTFRVTAVPSPTQLRVDNPINVLVAGTVGTIRRQSNILLNASDRIRVPEQIPLQMGDASLVASGDFLSINAEFQARQQSYSVERINASALSPASPSLLTNVTFVSMTGSGVATGTLPAGTRDGFMKIITATQITASYELVLPSLVDPGTGSNAISKKAVFTHAGQGIHLVWNHIDQSWFIVNGGAFVV